MKTNTTTKAQLAAEPEPEPQPQPQPQPQATRRRRHPRFAVDIQATISVDARNLWARTRDVSRDGLCLVSMEAIPRQKEIAIELVLTFGEDGMSEPLHVLGEVVWCTAMFGAHQIGVKFVKVDQDQLRYLNMFIGFLDGSLSAGEPGDETGSHGSPDDPDDPFAV